MADFLALLIVVAVLSGGTKSGRTFMREAWKATGWKTPRAAVRDRSGRAGAATGRAVAGASRVPRLAAAGLGRRTAGLGRANAEGLFRTRRGPLLPLMWRAVPDADEEAPAASSAAAPSGPAPQPEAPAPASAAPSRGPDVCVACGNPEWGPKRGGGNWGPLVLYREPIYDDGYPEEPRLIHKQHFEDESTGFYGRPYEPVPGVSPDDLAGGSPQPAGSNPTGGTTAMPVPIGKLPPGVGAVMDGTLSAAQQRRTNTTVRYVLNLEPPTTDGEFLESTVKIADVLKAIAEDIGNWADGLGALKLPQSVLNPLHQISDGITDAAHGASQAATNFESEFEDARDVASRGMHFTGQDAA